MHTTVIFNATIVTMNSRRDVLRDGFIVFEDGIIACMGQAPDCPEIEAERFIDARGSFVFPGLINVHTHSYQSYIRGIACDLPLDEWLRQSALPAASAMGERDVRLAAQACALDCLHSGTTTVVDMTPLPNLELQAAIARGHAQVGINAICAVGLRIADDDAAALSRASKDISDLARLADDEGLNRPMIAPYQVWNNSRKSFGVVRELADELGLRVITHACETAFDDEACRKLHGCGEIETLMQAGLLDERLTLIHGVCLTQEEASILADRGVTVGYSPVCNLFLGSGIPPITMLKDAGVNIALCSEGPACNNSNSMLEALKIGALLQKGAQRDAAALSALNVLEFATINGARALGMEKRIGSLEVGKDADLFVYNPLRSISSIPAHDPLTTLVYSYAQECVETVFVKGIPVLDNGTSTLVDEAAIISCVNSSARSFVRDNAIPRRDT